MGGGLVTREALATGVMSHAIACDGHRGAGYVIGRLWARANEVGHEWEGYVRIGCGRRQDVLAVYVPRAQVAWDALCAARVIAIMVLLAEVCS